MSKELPLVSIIVTSYNHAEYLPERMDSLLNQTYKNIEIIVIDDHSTDNSLNILENYERKFNNIRIVSLNKNTGVANASNLGANMASGEFIIFAECDDFSESKQIEKLVEALLNNQDAGIAFSRSNLVDGRGKKMGDDFKCRETSFRKYCYKDVLIKKEDMRKYLLISCVIPNMSAALLRKRIFDELSGFSTDFKLCIDWDFWCGASKITNFYYVTSKLNNFRFHERTARNTFQTDIQVNEIFKLLYNSYSNTKLTFPEKCKFKINAGAVWGSYYKKGVISWIVSFPFIWFNTLKYDKLGILYLVCGLVSKLYKKMKVTVIA